MDATPTNVPCPGCGVSLHAASVPDGILGGCSACGGIWVANDVCRRAMAGELSDDAKAWIKRVTDEARPHASGGYRTAPAATQRRCPSCGCALARATLQNPQVEVDFCKAHGAYFDRSELGAVAFEAELRAADAEAAAIAFKGELARASGSGAANALFSPSLGRVFGW
jgi:Zn-finger nucleic acid-binding protein